MAANNACNLWESLRTYITYREHNFFYKFHGLEYQSTSSSIILDELIPIWGEIQQTHKLLKVIEVILKRRIDFTLFLDLLKINSGVALLNIVRRQDLVELEVKSQRTHQTWKLRLTECVTYAQNQHICVCLIDSWYDCWRLVSPLHYTRHVVTLLHCPYEDTKNEKEMYFILFDYLAF